MSPQARCLIIAASSASCTQITRPSMVENANEITTEGGLDVTGNIAIVRAAVSRLRQAGILASLFIDPDPKQIEAAHDVSAQQIELCTAAYAEATLGSHGFHGEGALRVGQELRRLREGAALGTQYGLLIAAGHGLTISKAERLRKTLVDERCFRRGIEQSTRGAPVDLGVEH